MGLYMMVGSGGSIGETKEDFDAIVAAFGAWFAQLGDAIVDPGGSLIPEPVTVTADGVVAYDGPAPLTGYGVVRADSLEAAAAMAQASPKVQVEGGVMHVYPIRDVG